MQPVPDRPVVVTGASSGVGRELCSRLVAAGHAVLGVARRDPGVPGVVGVAADLARPGEAAEAVTAALAGRAPLALVSNAAVFDWCNFAEQDLVTAERIVTVNLIGAMAVTRGCLPAMIAARSGRIVQVVSVAGLRGIAGQAAYCASKWGMLGFAEALGQELQSHNVTVSSLCPGGIDTPLWDTTPYPGERDRLLPIGEVCDAIAFLLSRPPGSTYKRLVCFPGNEWH